ncbi:hypothetical protein DENSPDRAFT_670058 [Dentipellis sp. KUC8613]|nr:hypothetical protein DENSPDRAFT_670058 [Dentipellis sp. KUC8613]
MQCMPLVLIVDALAFNRTQPTYSNSSLWTHCPSSRRPQSQSVNEFPVPAIWLPLSSTMIPLAPPATRR